MSCEHRCRDPCEGCTRNLKVAILVVSGEHRCRDPCEGCSRNLKTAFLVVSGEHRCRDPCISFWFSKLVAPKHLAFFDFYFPPKVKKNDFSNDIQQKGNKETPCGARNVATFLRGSSKNPTAGGAQYYAALLQHSSLYYFKRRQGGLSFFLGGG